MREPITVYVMRRRGGRSVALNAWAASLRAVPEGVVAQPPDPRQGRDERVQQDVGAWREQRSFAPKG